MALKAVIRIGDSKKSIAGESVVGKDKGPKHMGEIDLISWSWGLTQTASSHIGSGAGSGTADVKDLTITKYLDKATPILLQECFHGNNQAEAVLTCIKVGGTTPVEFLKITMSGTVFLSAVTTGDPGPNDTLTETVKINFSKVKIEYSPQGFDQSAGAPTTGQFDISAAY